MISTKKTLEEERASILTHFESARGIIHLIQKENKINEIIKFEPSIPVLIWKLLHLPHYTICSPALKPVEGGNEDPLMVTVPFNISYYAGDRRFVAARGQQLSVNTLMHTNYFSRNDGLELRTNPSAIKTGHYRGVVDWLITQFNTDHADNIQLDPIKIYDQLSSHNSDWSGYHLQANQTTPDISIAAPQQSPEKITYRIIRELPFYNEFNNNFEVEMFMSSLNMAKQLENDKLGDATDYIDNIAHNLSAQLEELYTKHRLNLGNAYKYWVYSRNFGKELPNTLSAAERKIIDKQMREYIKYIDLQRCEHQIAYTDITDTINVDEKHEKFAALMKELKLVDKYWTCTHKRKVICSHNADYIRLQMDKQSEKTIAEYIDKYTGEIIRGTRYCQICGEEIRETSDMIMTSIFSKNVLRDVYDAEVTLRKTLWRDAYFTLNNITFAGLYSDKYKQRLANEITKAIIIPVKKQLTPIDKIRTATPEQLEARRRFIRHVFIYGFMVQLIKNNPKVITFKQKPPVKIPTKLGDTKFDNILAAAINLIMYLLAGSIKQIPNMTRSVVQTIMIKAISLIKSGGDLEITKENTVSTVHDSAAARYMIAVYNQHNDKPMTHSQLQTFTADYPKNFYKYTNDAAYTTIYNYINGDYTVDMYNVTIEKTDFGYNITPVLHNTFVELTKQLHDLHTDPDVNPRNPILRIPRFNKSIRYSPQLGTAALAAVYGIKGGFHKHIFNRDEKGKPLSQLQPDVVPKKIVCSICNMTRAESLAASHGIYKAYENFYDKQLFYAFIKYYCPKSISGHEFVKNRCKFCKWDGTQSDAYMKQYYKSYENFRHISAYKPPQVSGKAPATIKQTDVKSIATPKYYSVGLSKKEYANVWKNIGAAENRSFKDIISGHNSTLSHCGVVNYIHELIVLINKIKNYGKYPDSTIDKLAGQTVPPITDLREILNNPDHYTASYSVNKLIIAFNKLGTDAAKQFVSDMIGDTRAAAQPDAEVVARNLLTAAQINIDEPDDEFATFTEASNVYDEFDVNEEDLENDDQALDAYLENN